MNTRNTTDDEKRNVEQFEHWHDFVDDNNRSVKVYGIQIFVAGNHEMLIYHQFMIS